MVNTSQKRTKYFFNVAKLTHGSLQFHVQRKIIKKILVHESKEKRRRKRKKGRKTGLLSPITVQKSTGFMELVKKHSNVNSQLPKSLPAAGYFVLSDSRIFSHFQWSPARTKFFTKANEYITTQKTNRSRIWLA